MPLPAGLYFCLLVDGETIDLDDKSDPVSSTVNFEFARKNDDDEFTKDSYFPNKRSCRDNCICHGCVPPVNLPRAAFIEFFADDSEDPFPPGWDAMDFPATVFASERDATSTTFVNSIPGASRIELQFEQFADEFNGNGNVGSWGEDGYPIKAIITIRNQDGPSWRLVRLSETLANGTGELSLELLPPIRAVIVPSKTTPPVFNTSERLLLWSRNSCSAPNIPFFIPDQRVNGVTEFQTGRVENFTGEEVTVVDGEIICWPTRSPLHPLGIFPHNARWRSNRSFCFDVHDGVSPLIFKITTVLKDFWFQRVTNTTLPPSASSVRVPRLVYSGQFGGSPFPILDVRPVSQVGLTGSRLYDVIFSRTGTSVPMVIPEIGSQDIEIEITYTIRPLGNLGSYDAVFTKIGTVPSTVFPDPWFVGLNVENGLAFQRQELFFNLLSPVGYDVLVHGAGIVNWVTDGTVGDWTDEPHLFDYRVSGALEVVL